MTLDKSALVGYFVAIVLGLAVAFLDLAEPFGDDSSKLTLLLLIVFSGILAFVHPKKPWRWGILVGIWLPLVEFGGPRTRPVHTHPSQHLFRLFFSWSRFRWPSA